MLSKSNRISKRTLIPYILRKGNKVISRNFIIRFLLKDNEEQTPIFQFAFLVSKKISKKATDRNRVKRRLSEISRDYIKNKSQVNSYKKKYYIAIIPSPQTLNMKFEDLKADLNGVLDKIN